MTEEFQTKIVKIDENNLKEVLEEAVFWLHKGFPVAFPTETVYGLGASVWDDESIGKIFRAKGRPADNPLIVHVTSLEMAASVVSEIGSQAQELMEKFWPGPLTLVLPKKSELPLSVTAGLPSVGLRMPNHQIAIALIEKFGLPLAAPSANASGRPSPTRAEHVLADLKGKIPLIIDGGQAIGGVESTVLDLTSQPPLILRPGAVTYEMLLPYLPDLIDASQIKDREKPKSPGLKYVHYSPKATVGLYCGKESDVCGAMTKDLARFKAQGQKTALIITSLSCPLEADIIFDLRRSSEQEMLKETARHLFEYFRMADSEGVDRILLQGVIEKDLGRALMNRMRKAAKEMFVFDP